MIDQYAPAPRSRTNMAAGTAIPAKSPVVIPSHTSVRTPTRSSCVTFPWVAPEDSTLD